MIRILTHPIGCVFFVANKGGLMNFYNLLSNVYFSDTFEPIGIWMTVGIVSALILCWAIVYFTKKEASGKVAKYMFIGFIFYALALGIFMLSLEIAKKYDTAYLDDKWVSRDITSYVFLPVLITMIIALLGGIALFIISKKKPSLFKTTAMIVGGLCLAGIIVSLILVYVFYSNNIVDDGYYTAQDYGRLNNFALYGFSAFLVIVSIVVAFLLGKNDKNGFDTRCISIAGVCVALSFALSYIKLYEMPYGGSVTLFSMLPVMIFAFVYGTKKGLLIGLLYGILQAIQDPFIIHPAQFLLDYPIAFAMMGFAGSLTGFKVLDKRPQIKFCVSAIIGGTLRYICHVLSGVFAFGAWTLDAMYKSEGIFAYRAPAGDAMTNFWIYSLAYNSYVFIDILLVIVAGVFLFSSKAFRKEVEKLKPLIEEK